MTGILDAELKTTLPNVYESTGLKWSQRHPKPNLLEGRGNRASLMAATARARLSDLITSFTRWCCASFHSHMFQFQEMEEHSSPVPVSQSTKFIIPNPFNNMLLGWALGSGGVFVFSRTQSY
jgi:hypothetical protein